MNRVFVSSTFVDLEDYRAEVIKSIRQLGAIDVSMENFGSRDERPMDECLKMIKEETDTFVGIYAHRYGYVPPNETTSITELEYNEAAKLNKPRFVYLIDEKTPWIPEYIDKDEHLKKLINFKNKLAEERVLKKFSDKHHLAASVSADLGRHFLQNTYININATSKQSGLEKRNLSNPETWSKDRDGRYANCRGIFLAHVLWPSDNPLQEYDIYIYLIPHQKSDLGKVKYAEFFLGRFWKNTIFKVNNVKNKIGIYTSAYGPFLCVCKIVFEDGHEAIIDRYIDFEHGKLIHDVNL